MTELPNADCYPLNAMPGMSRLFLDFCAGKQEALRFFGAGLDGAGATADWQTRPAAPAHWPELLKLLGEQNGTAGGAALAALNALGNGAGTVVTGQQVGLLGGPLLTALKSATALARARQATAAGRAHAAIFWLATEDHDFAEIDHLMLPSGRALETVRYAHPDAAAARPVGGLVLGEEIAALVERAQELLGPGEASDALAAAYRPGRTFAQAFGDFYRTMFAAQGLLTLDASGRALHRIGAPVLRAALERADELHSALLERNGELEAAGYHAQVAVGEHNSLLFLLDEGTGARVALKRTAPTAGEPEGLWQAGARSYSTADLTGILEAEPERISPSALLRPVFQDYLLSSSLTIGGPAEIAYFAQSGVLYERILGRQTPAEPRLFATLIEPGIAKLLERHGLALDQLFTETPATLAQRLAEQSMPAETKQKLAAAGKALDDELDALVGWMQAEDKGLGQSAETAAGKIRYQMNRLRTLAANFQLQRETSYSRHAESVMNALYPEGHLQERVHGAAYYFARYGAALAERLTGLAEEGCEGHAVVAC